MAPPLLYAHRGAAAELPENTIPAFERALELGADVLEMDAHVTADGQVVISHDPGGQRTTGVDALFRDVELAEVKRWDAGYGFVDEAGERPFAGRGYQVPTLEEVLIEFPDVLLNVDLKQPSARLVRETIRVIRRRDAEERALLASFHLRTLLGVRALGYRGATALTRPEVVALLVSPRFVFRRLPFTGVAAQVPTKVAGLTLACRWLIDKCHALGLRIDFWTVNDAAEAERLLDLGADGIMTDDPAAIAPVFARREEQSRDAPSAAALD